MWKTFADFFRAATRSDREPGGRIPNGDMRMDHAHAHYLPTAEGVRTGTA